MIALPDFLTAQYFGNPLWHYIAFFVALFAGYILGKIIAMLVIRYIRFVTRKTKNRLDDVLLHSFEQPLLLFVVIMSGYATLYLLGVNGKFLDVATRALKIGLVFAGAWFAARLIDSTVVEYLRPAARKSESNMDDQLIPVIRKGSKGVVWSIGLVMMLDTLGINVGALIAGLGVGGLAFAFAAKDTIENLISGFLIFLDKPFKLGDWVEVSGHSGIIEEVGIRSTRIRTWDNTLVTIPNKNIVGDEIENYQARKKNRIKMNIGLVYGTSATKMAQAKKVLNQVLDGFKGVGKTDRRIIFDSFGDYSLNITLIYHIHDQKNHFKIKDEVNFAILKAFNKAKLEMAFPTQTVELKK